MRKIKSTACAQFELATEYEYSAEEKIRVRMLATRVRSPTTTIYSIHDLT